jgi:uncharacterized YigZ family protein
MNDTYRTIKAPAAAELKVKGSRFLAEAAPVTTAEAADVHIETVRKREYSATHHCTAYRVGPQGQTFRYNDDGEPSGTAGPPILRQIDGRELTNTLVVVTRYYGGTKLGTGGLVRAYGDAAALALDHSQIVERVLREHVRVRFAYDDTSPAMHTIHRYDAEIVDTHYTDETEITVAVRRSEVAAFIDTFIDALAGRGEASRMGPL